MHSAIAYIGLGANLGDPRQTLTDALREIAESPGISECRASKFYGSTPVDAQGPTFVNAVARICTTLAPTELLAALQRIEMQHGRERPHRNAPRTLDLDILLYDDQRIDSTDLVVPHPRMHQRAFVLAPLAEIAPGMMLREGTVESLLAQCEGQGIWPLDPVRSRPRS